MSTDSYPLDVPSLLSYTPKDSKPFKLAEDFFIDTRPQLEHVFNRDNKGWPTSDVSVDVGDFTGVLSWAKDGLIRPIRQGADLPPGRRYEALYAATPDHRTSASLRLMQNVLNVCGYNLDTHQQTADHIAVVREFSITLRAESDTGDLLTRGYSSSSFDEASGAWDSGRRKTRSAASAEPYSPLDIGYVHIDNSPPLTDAELSALREAASLLKRAVQYIKQQPANS